MPPHIPSAPASGAPVPETDHRGRTVFVIAAAALIIVAIVFVVIVPAQKSRTDFTGPVTQLHVTAKSFDPQAKPPTEREDETHLAVDGNAATVWRTDHYNSAAFGNLKDGVGLILQGDAASELTSVTISSPTRGWTVEAYAAESPAATLAGWGRALASAKVDTASTTLALNGARGGAVLLWITNLGPSQQVRIGEATVQGRVAK
jgi:hypothetical protein